jgi:hypothetical protein
MSAISVEAPYPAFVLYPEIPQVLAGVFASNIALRVIELEVWL